MFCEKCGKELRQGVKFCPGCGTAIIERATVAEQTIPTSNGTGKLIVYGYKEWYAVRPKVDILKNDIKVAEVNADSMVEIPIEENCTITFKCMMRKTTVYAIAGKTQTVQLSFDRISGELLAIVPNQENNTYTEGGANSAPTVANAGISMNTQNKKSKEVAGLLGILLGGFGAHKFYLGHYVTGVFYLLFCWTYFPAIFGLIEGIIYLTESKERFDSRCR